MLLVPFDLIDYLGEYISLCEVNRFRDHRNNQFVIYRRRRHRDYSHADEQLPSNYGRKRLKLVLSDLDTVNTCDRPMVKLLKKYCWEWDCQSKIFQKIQVS